MILAVFVALLVIFVLGSIIWNIFWFMVTAVITGLVFGGLGRLVVPGRNPIGLLPTMACGVVGSFLGVAIGRGVGLGWIATVLIEVGLAAVAVFFWDMTHRTPIGGSRRSLSGGR